MRAVLLIYVKTTYRQNIHNKIVYTQTLISIISIVFFSISIE